MSKNFYDSKKNSPKDFHKIPDKPAQSTLRISGESIKGVSCKWLLWGQLALPSPF